MGLFSSKSKSSSSSIANEIVTAAEGNNPQPTTITASNQSDAVLKNTGIVNRAYKSQQTFNVNRSTADSYSKNDNSYNRTTRNSNVNNRRYDRSFNRAHNSHNRSYSATTNTSNSTVNRTTNDSNNTVGSTIFGRGSSAWNKNTLGAYAKVNSGNTSYRFRDKANVYINNLPPMFDGSFSGNSGGGGNFEARNDDRRNARQSDFRVSGVSESNPFTQTTGAKDTSNATDQKSDTDKLSKYVLIAAAVAGTYMLVGKKKGRSSGRGLALR